jgi:hypothetical protein
VRDGKKKVDKELNTYFPGKFESAKQKQYYVELKKRTDLTLRQIIDNQDNEKKIKEIDNVLYTFIDPQRFDGRESAEIRFTRAFENACMMVSEVSGRDAKRMTVFEFNAILTRDGRKPNQSKRPVRR